jgi:hypothetical protein
MRSATFIYWHNYLRFFMFILKCQNYSYKKLWIISLNFYFLHFFFVANLHNHHVNYVDFLHFFHLIVTLIFWAWIYVSYYFFYVDYMYFVQYINYIYTATYCTSKLVCQIWIIYLPLVHYHLPTNTSVRSGQVIRYIYKSKAIKT